MTQLLNETTDPHAERYWVDLESALMAGAIANAPSLPLERIKALRRLWTLGLFNARAHGIPAGPAGQGVIEWTTNGKGMALHYQSPTGLSCHLANVYQQSDSSYAALVVAGVRSDLYDAIAAAEWAIARLTA